MTANTGLLAGKTLFITGASRGIGKSIALKAARDGANIVIASKTAEKHPKLPGTIYTAAKEVEAAGGKCLPCIVDIRHENQVAEAVDSAVKTFGGIDILVNNASAISLTGTSATPMKKFDLMMGVNTRGTYLCSQACIPHLKLSKNPHILNLSPPLSLKPIWFKNHVAYTMAKYGMSMCVLGMADELREYGIAVNALWPKTSIHTAALDMIAGSDVMSSKSRTPEILADAAYLILSKDSKMFTGNFVIDETLLTQEGVTDLEKYSVKPGESLYLDFFVDGDPGEGFVRPDMYIEQLGIKTKETGGAGTVGGAGDVASMIPVIRSVLSNDLVSSINGVFQFDLKGSESGRWFLDLKNAAGSFGDQTPTTDVNCTVTLDSEDFVKMFKGELKPTSAFMAGRLKIKGDMALAMKLEKVMGSVRSKL